MGFPTFSRPLLNFIVFVTVLMNVDFGASLIIATCATRRETGSAPCYYTEHLHGAIKPVHRVLVNQIISLLSHKSHRI
ncbi:hypothetical protein Ocin01_17497 [Orchesella cincta]|uniref:Uncharacterized protein n=1 Tax=Orchesella cincta TaxID=48709 RepID=A0A1D2M884_ORCCI|nr:hypothetical protein Ocin01_17497 [Orchesella cincta]